MDVKLVLLLNYAALIYCQKTNSCINEVEWQDEFFEDIRYEIESIRQLISAQQKADVCNERRAIIQEMNSEIQDIRQILSDQTHVLETLRDKWRENGTCKKSCPPGFDYLPEVGSCYRVMFERMTWDNATETCRQMMPGVHLAAITSKEENNAIIRYLQSQFSGGNHKCWPISASWNGAENLMWIGGQTKNPRRCGDPYVWKPLRGIEIPFNYTNWSSGSPDCSRAREHCVHVVTGNNYIWNDYPCDWLSCPICELHV